MMDTNNLNLKFGFIGGGNMAKAIFNGMIKSNLAKASQVCVSAPSACTRKEWEGYGATAFQENGRIMEESDVIFLCVKPHILNAAFSEISNVKNSDKAHNKLILSVIAGASLLYLEKLFAAFHPRIIRVMPNTPVMVGKGCTVYATGANDNPQDNKIVETIFNSCGSCTKIPETQFSAAGALASSGPAFIYTVLEALSDGAVKMGLPRQLATSLAAQMVEGAAQMVLSTGKHTGQLKDEVCSPGGTTIVGIHKLEEHGLRNALMSAVEASALKSMDLGK